MPSESGWHDDLAAARGLRAPVDAVPRAEGLVGGHRSRRPGEGTDVAGVRPFVPGDRLRRVNWRVTGRTGELHVTATYSDRDTEVLLCLDSRQDLGRPPDSCAGHRGAGRGGGRRALPARRRPGRRWSTSASATGRCPPATAAPSWSGCWTCCWTPGRRPTNRLRTGTPAGGRADRPGSARHALVVLLSPLATAASLQAVAGLSRAGRSVVAVDTLPAGLRPGPRAATTRSWPSGCGGCAGTPTCAGSAELGVPVVPWRGAGSLDAVLRDVRRAARAPRVGR